MANKKLIEVALPLEAINAASAREKSIRHGHPSTLHLWWARRPLAAARAVIWASLVDDPSSHPEEFPTEKAQQDERDRLFKILEDLVVWENSNDKDVLEAAKKEILKSTGGVLPELLDPFAGGGTIPLEAQRLGLKAHAHDLNPVAVTLCKALTEIPSRFANRSSVRPKSSMVEGGTWKNAEGLSEDIRYYGNLLKELAYKEIGHLYPSVKYVNESGEEEELTVIAWLWARTVASPDPRANGAYVPLISSKMLSKKAGKNSWVEIVEDESAQDGWRFSVKNGDVSAKDEAILSLGTKMGKGKDFICCLTNSPIQREYIQEEGKAGRLSKRLMAIVAEGKKGRIYLTPSVEHETAPLSKQEQFNLEEMKSSFLSGKTPTRAMVTGGVCSAYGLSTWGDLFTERQLNILDVLCSLLTKIRSQVEVDALSAGMGNDSTPLSKGGRGARAYGEAIAVYLAFVIDKLADYGSSACGWNTSGEKLRNTFARQGIPMVWDFAEGNPFCSSSGSYDNMLNWVYKAVENLPTSESCAEQRAAQNDCGLRNIMVSTDPPYYDNIGYAILSDFFYVWLRRSLKDIYPELFQTMLVPKAEELVATPYRHDGSAAKAKEFFEAGMLETCKQISNYADNKIPVTIYYAYKQSDSVGKGDKKSVASSGWETMLTAIIESGFAITGTWPMRTEMANRSVAMGTNALASSVVLVCRKRDEDAPQTTRRNVVNLLRRELRPALENLQNSNIAPVDLAQSSIGPGMAVFSRYSRVLEADGTPMTVRAALQVINEEIDLYFNEQVGDLDIASRFCVDLYAQNAYGDVKYGEAEVLANAKGISIPMVAARGVLFAKGGVVRLLERDHLPNKVVFDEPFIWKLTQQLTRAMTVGGIELCAKLVAPMMGSNAERAKDLAYRLYTLAEQKKWTNEAYAYNSLVVAWSDIQSRAAALKELIPKQTSVFDFTNSDGAE